MTGSATSPPVDEVPGRPPVRPEPAHLRPGQGVRPDDREPDHAEEDEGLEAHADQPDHVVGETESVPRTSCRTAPTGNPIA